MLHIIDHDLLSVQEARILSENAREAQKTLVTYPQEKLDEIVECMAAAIGNHSLELARMSQEETDYGIWQDKHIKNRFVCEYLPRKLRGMRCVGVINKDEINKITDVGIPVGVVLNLCSATSPVSTVINGALIAIKSGNAMVFSPHPRAKKSIEKALNIMIEAAIACGLPENALSYLQTLTQSGTCELINSKNVNLIINSGVPTMLDICYKSGKPVIYGGAGNGPVFIERTANIKQAVSDIIASKTFDNGVVSASEQGVVVDACIASQVKSELQANGAYFMTQEEEDRLANLLYHQDGRLNSEAVGKSALDLGRMANIALNPNTKVLISQQKYVSPVNPYSKEKFCPVMAFYIEDDWMNACEKCIELLLSERTGHTLVIHSNDESVIEQFALKKPVARVLVNTPSTFGSMGLTTNLFPAMTLGSASAGEGITSDNVSPLNLIYIRKVGYGVRNFDELGLGTPQNQATQTPTLKDLENIDLATLQKILKEFLQNSQ